MIFWLILFLLAAAIFKFAHDVSKARENRAAKLKDIERRLAQKKQREQSGETETPEEARARRRNNRRR